ncbi:hypothetical protein AQUCO_00300177v1 [Aquilegia coerulea]|uniref:Uncharacterized protein n=1 Tax=Aquilegia coerulea TaxID=218851 RepID=A0A2G5EXN4_AQUCA|nr:hypothetical protein AQUCO_00300177v1 [Aquilegia coerulea]
MLVMVQIVHRTFHPLTVTFRTMISLLPFVPSMTISHPILPLSPLNRHSLLPKTLLTQFSSLLAVLIGLPRK